MLPLNPASGVWNNKGIKGIGSIINGALVEVVKSPRNKVVANNKDIIFVLFFIISPILPHYYYKKEIFKSYYEIDKINSNYDFNFLAAVFSAIKILF